MQGTHITIYTNEHPAINNTEDASVILKIMLINTTTLLCRQLSMHSVCFTAKASNKLPSCMM